MAAGTIVLTNNSTAVTGTSTAFKAASAVNDFIVAVVGGVTYTLGIKSIESDTALTLNAAYTGPTASGAAWSAVANQTLVGITAQIAADTARAIRGLNLDKANWQGFYTGTGNTTIELPDGTSVTGPSWPAMVNTLSGKLDRSGGTLTGKVELPGMEINAAIPYIDFHFNKSTDDFSSRIYADSATRLTISNGLRIGTSLQVDDGVNIDGVQTVAAQTVRGYTYYPASNTYLGGSNGASQGLHFRWNEDSTFSGAGSLIVNPGLGNGGFRMRFINKENTANTGIVSFTRTGGIQASDYIMSPNQLWSLSGRVKMFTAVATGYLELNIDGGSYGINIFASDERLKNNIKDADKQVAYEAVKNVRLRSFNLKTFAETEGDGDKWEFGFIAQEAREHLKGSVITDKLSYLQVDPLALCGYLIGTVQVLQDKVEALESKAEATEANISELLKRMKAIDGLDA
ncbi:tail fiber domain-containing protein [Erwinia sp. STN24]|uniref:tail fiber domain-containing protein n=1 Tax=Erwinia sp. STN24 TaxID=3233996 RepID=UPI00352229AB